MTLLAALGSARSVAAAEPAAPPPPGLEGAVWLDARAPVFAAIHPTDLGDGFALMDLIGGIFPETMRALNRVRDGLGLYAFSRGEFSESGVDPDGLVLASWGLVDEADWAARGKKGSGKPVFARHRFVIKALDADKLVRATVAILAGANVSVANFARAHGDPSIPAWAVEGDLKSIARHAGILVLGRARDGALVSLRRAGDYAIVDYADPWGPSGEAKGDAKPDGKADIAATLSKMVAPPKQPLASALAQGTRKLLSTEDVSIALVVEPAALAPLFSRPSCRRDWVGGDAALFDDAAVLLRLHPFQWRLEVAWGLTALGKAKLGGVASDDGVIDARAAAADGIAAAGFMVDGFESIRGAPRPPVLTGKPERVLESLAACGPLSWLEVGARFWPQLAASELERLTASVSGTSGSAALLANLRNVGAVIRRLPEKNQGWESGTVLLGSIPGTAEAGVTDLLAAQASGKPETQAFGGRSPTFFDLSAGTGFSEAGLEHIAAGHLSLALTPQAAGLGWYYRLARRPARFGPQNNIGYLHVNVARLLESWSEESDQGTRAAVRLAAGQLGQLGGNLSLDGDLVRLALDLSGNDSSP
ncbi:MAG TPA: hypothetical protein VHL80_13260 [Polyangia bacterium]|nr:hypothetical protein [Polyangia bacterium]